MAQIQNTAQTRWKSAPLWIALAAQVIGLLVVVGVIDAGQSEVLNGLIVAVCEALTAFGILNNPTNKTGF